MKYSSAEICLISLCYFLHISQGLAQSKNITQSKAQTIPIVTVQGPYQYDMDGVPLIGYIYVSVSQIQFSSSEKVSLHICNTRNELNVNFGDLTRVDRECPKPIKSDGPFKIGSWTEWKLQSGTLVAEKAVFDKGFDKTVTQQFTAAFHSSDSNLANFHVGDAKEQNTIALPPQYKGLFIPNNEGKTIAVTLPSSDGKPQFGVIKGN